MITAFPAVGSMISFGQVPPPGGRGVFVGVLVKSPDVAVGVGVFTGWADVGVGVLVAVGRLKFAVTFLSPSIATVNGFWVPLTDPLHWLNP